MTIYVYGEVGLDWLADTFPDKRWGGAGLYASLAAAKHYPNIKLLTVYGPELNRNVINQWENLRLSFEESIEKPTYTLPRYLVTGYEGFSKKQSRPMNEIKNNVGYDPILKKDAKALLVFPIGHSLPKQLCKDTYERGIPVFLDPKPNNESINDARELLIYTTVLLVNEEEALLLSNKKHLEEAVQKLISLGPEAIIIKRGVRGSIIITNKGDRYVVKAYKSKVRCTLGSGDVFGGIFIVNYIESNDLILSAKIATCVTSKFIEQFEPEKIISKKAALEYLEDMNEIDIPEHFNKSIYLAGPFFNVQELDWVNRICNKLEGAGLNVYSPSKENGIIPTEASPELRRSTFESDILLIDKSNIVVALIDHDDTGTSFEIGYAYNKGIPIIGLRTSCSQVNNMISQSCSRIVNNVDDLINEIYRYG